MDTNAYVTFLVVGVVTVVIDGQIIYHSGKRYLRHSAGDPAAESSMTRLVVVLFHLAVLGVLALLSTVRFPGGGSLPGVVGRLGVLLLIVAVAHGIAIGVLTRLREEQAVEDYRNRPPVDRRLPEATIRPIDPSD
ncbi:hypothetical protein [Amycolatopsis alkalitolerans]|uniref:hypothetical protein n=1 Tax=Amycolatopsis alkalitolerans TaxID=2547244 RepID=UPI001F1D24D8|nr:hypothetical protein [Amycolatopsis alkalitolerans]